MIRFRHLLCLTLLCSFGAATLAQSDAGEFIQLKVILDEARGHCLDIDGAGANIDLHVPFAGTYLQTAFSESR